MMREDEKRGGFRRPGERACGIPRCMACIPFAGCLLAAVVLAAAAGCRSPASHLGAADRRAQERIERIMPGALGREGGVRLDDRPSDALRRRLWGDAAVDGAAPDRAALPERIRLTLHDALMVGAAHSRDYQARKEDVFRAALQWDVENEALRTSWAGALSGAYTDDRSSDPDTRGVEQRAEITAGRVLRTGADLGARLAVDLVRLLTLDRDSAFGILADVSVTVPLLRGAGRAVVTEAATQAERDVVYALYELDRFRRSYAVRVATEFLNVLEREQQIRNAEDNVRRLEASTLRAERLAAAGRLPEIQLDQIRQDQLRAQDRLLTARQTFARARDGFALTLGLPAGVGIELDERELERLAERITAAQDDDSAGSVPARAEAIALALAHRLDLRKAEGEAEDARRRVVVAENALRANLKLEAGATAGEARALGSAGRGDASLRPAEGRYRARLLFEPSWSRARERAAYRNSLIAVDRAERARAELEDRIRVDVTDDIRSVLRADEGYRIQRRAVDIARRRVESTEMFIQAGRAQVRDLLEAQEALVGAQNALVSAVVAYRVAQLNLQRDIAVLALTEEGWWHEPVWNVE